MLNITSTSLFKYPLVASKYKPLSYPLVLLDSLNPTLPSISLATYRLEVFILVLIWTDHQSPLKKGKYILAFKFGLSPSAGTHFRVP